MKWALSVSDWICQTDLQLKNKNIFINYKINYKINVPIIVKAQCSRILLLKEISEFYCPKVLPIFVVISDILATLNSSSVFFHVQKLWCHLYTL